METNFSRKLLPRVVPAKFSFPVHLHNISYFLYITYITYIMCINFIYITYIIYIVDRIYGQSTSTDLLQNLHDVIYTGVFTQELLVVTREYTGVNLQPTCTSLMIFGYYLAPIWKTSWTFLAPRKSPELLPFN